MTSITSKKIILEPPVSITYIKDPFTGNTILDEKGKFFHVGTEDEKNFFRVMIEGKGKDPIKLYFNSVRQYDKWKNIRNLIKTN